MSSKPLTQSADRRVKLAHDLGVIFDQARRNGTINRLKEVAIYFDAEELQTILAALTREQERST